MPLWNVYCPGGAFSAQQRKTLAADITTVYTEYGRMPAFYVDVVFHEVTEGSLLIGGEPVNNFIRITVAHIARQLRPDQKRATMDLLESVLARHIKDRGFDWEIHIDETPRELWNIQGFRPPDEGSDAEGLWIKENRPVPYDVGTAQEIESETHRD